MPLALDRAVVPELGEGDVLRTLAEAAEHQAGESFHKFPACRCRSTGALRPHLFR